MNLNMDATQREGMLMNRQVCPHCHQPVSVSDIGNQFLKRTFTSPIECRSCHAFLKVRRARAMVIGWAIILGVMCLGGLLGEHFLPPSQQPISAALGMTLLWFAYAWVGPLLCTLELRTLPGQGRPFG
jgi:hypothetical protein